jgi:hypothetical protein
MFIAVAWWGEGAIAREVKAGFGYGHKWEGRTTQIPFCCVWLLDGTEEDLQKARVWARNQEGGFAFVVKNDSDDVLDRVKQEMAPRGFLEMGEERPSPFSVFLGRDWEIRPEGNGSRLIKGRAIWQALRDRQIIPYTVTDSDLLFTETPFELQAKMKAVDYGVYVCQDVES